MKQLFLITLCISLLSILLVSCGQSSQAANSFIFTSANTIMFLQWQYNNDNQISGQWYSVTYTSPYDQTTQATISTIPITGTASNGQLTIQSSSITLATGSEQNNGLTLNGANSEGQTQTTHWYATDQQTYNQLVRVFEAYMSMHVKIALLSQTLALLPPDSDQATGQSQVQGLKSYLSFIQATWNDDVSSQNSHTEKCTGLQSFLAYYPYTGDFNAPDASKSTLSKQIDAVNMAWKQAQADQLPTLPQGMTTPWRLIGSQVTADLKPAQQMLTNLQIADKQAQQQMTTLHGQYTTFSTRVEALKKTC